MQISEVIVSAFILQPCVIVLSAHLKMIKLDISFIMHIFHCCWTGRAISIMVSSLAS